MRGLLVLAFSTVALASQIDTTRVYTIGVNPSVMFTFNSDGQAYTADGVPVTFITFGAIPQVPCDDCGYSAPYTPPLDPPIPPVIVSVPQVPHSDTPETETVLVVGSALCVLSRIWERKR